jgi:ApbE superfamily uncharacterized protein (UPF0280 family)
MGRVEPLAGRSLTPPARPAGDRSGPARARLDARRWHFQHGPIDLVLQVDGPAAAAACERGWRRFATVLEELVAELPLLRSPVTAAAGVRGAVAQRMTAACWPHRGRFITPMAAVAGAVADEVLAAMTDGEADVSRAYVNNGGDIALHLGPGATFRAGIVTGDAIRHGHGLALDGEFELTAALPVRGVATSGWRGRSWSLGIADGVTVLARDGAAADAAATMIANAVDIDHPAITRARACDVADDTDLGERLVTTAVGPLPEEAVAEALARGAAHARALVAHGLVWGAVLALQSRTRVVGGIAVPEVH